MNRAPAHHYHHLVIQGSILLVLPMGNRHVRNDRNYLFSDRMVFSSSNPYESEQKVKNSFISN